MGYKDDRWLEAPGYCVECGNLRPLNKSAVCHECWCDLEILGEYWEEDEDRSRIYYERLSTQDKFSKHA
jgi:hypothetical protein